MLHVLGKNLTSRLNSQMVSVKLLETLELAQFYAHQFIFGMCICNQYWLLFVEYFQTQNLNGYVQLLFCCLEVIILRCF